MIQAAEPRPTFAAGSTVRSSGEHHRKLERLQQLGGRRRQTTLLFGAALVFVLLTAALAAADFVWELPWLLRAAALASVVASIVGGFVALRRRLRFEAADAAAKAEATWPELGQRLRTSHDYALMPDRVAPADPRLIESLQDDTAERMRDRKVEPLAPAWPVWAVGGALACAAIAWLATLAAEPEWRTATARLALLPVEYTTVDVKPLPEKIGMGESLKVEATVVGRPLDDARVLYRPVDSDEAWSELPMDLSDGDLLIGEVRAEIADVRRDIEVLVEAGPREHPPQMVVVRIPLELVQWKAKVEPPAYTR
ncbi:MAG: hypothetical protein KDA71_12510, partial [Planctomycetales bacterium]|nr:hypothetical protein [Planctomycetales bacterium]